MLLVQIYCIFPKRIILNKTNSTFLSNTYFFFHVPLEIILHTPGGTRMITFKIPVKPNLLITNSR